MQLQNPLFPEIANRVTALNALPIPEDRKAVLQVLIDYIQHKVTDGENIRLNFICTHNSRRSHLAQVWAQALASYFNIKNVFCYSGGTEATALFPMAIKTLEHAGFGTKVLSDGKNPVYGIKYAENEPPVIGFSKTYDDEFNPKSKFAAIMTCSQADSGCPFILGAEKRISLPFDDPKAYDNSAQQAEQYRKTSLQIASELFYVFSKIQAH